MGGVIAYELAQCMRIESLKAVLIAASAEPIYAIENELNKPISDERLKRTISVLVHV